MANPNTETTVELELTFATSEGDERTISLSNIDTNLEGSTVSAAMDAMIASNTLMLNYEIALTQKVRAQYVWVDTTAVNVNASQA